MSDDESADTTEELGETAEKIGGIADRFGESEMTETSETNETAPSGKTSETITTKAMSETTSTEETSDSSMGSETTAAAGGDELNIREDWNGRTIYLPDDLVEDLDLRYQECSLAWQREHGEDLAKNERFYPAVIRAALHETSIEEELGLEN